MLQLLVIEDSELDYRLLVATLAQQGIACASTRVESAAELRDALGEHAWELVISDHCLPGFSSSESSITSNCNILAPLPRTSCGAG